MQRKDSRGFHHLREFPLLARIKLAATAVGPLHEKAMDMSSALPSQEGNG
jgi:hypothetical protein